MGVLNFSTENLITGVNIIDGNLYWTDNLNEPKKLEIDKFKDTTGEYNISNSESSTRIRGEEFNEADISVIRPHPWKPITLELEEYNPTEEEKLAKPDPPFEKIFPRFSYRWKYEDGQYSPYAPFTQAAFISKERVLVSQDAWDNTAAYAIGALVNFNGISWLATENINAPVEGNINEDPGAELSTTWSAQGPEVYSSEEANYIDGYNTTMFNNVGMINLNDIPRGPRDVVAIDLLYTESISSTIYVLETIDIPINHRGKDFTLSPNYSLDDSDGRVPNTGEPRYPIDYTLLPLRYQLSARKIYSALPANQLSRPYDEVPRTAKAQEITANRLLYGNYEIGFDQPESLLINKNFVTAGTGDGLNVKGNRKYEIGVAYIDSYGRQGAMIQAGTVTKSNGEIEEQFPLASVFNQQSRQQITAEIKTAAPAWADKYRYFIKDTSTDYQSLISYNVYNDGSVGDSDSEFVWIEFQSTDRNKIVGGPGDNDATTLILRRENDEVSSVKRRFLVQDIENEAPDDVRNQLRNSLTNSDLAKAKSVNEDLQTQSGNADNSVGDTQIIIDGGSTSSRSTRSFIQTNVVEPINELCFANENKNSLSPLEKLDVTNAGEYGGEVVTEQTINVDQQLNSPIYVRFQVGATGDKFLGGNFKGDTYVQVLEFGVGAGYGGISSSASGKSLGMKLGGHFIYDEDSGLIPVEETEGLPTFPPNVSLGANLTFQFYSSRLSTEAIERLGGRFFVRTARNGLVTAEGFGQSKFNFEGELQDLKQLWFETEPAVDESNLDLFWESSETFCVCTQHGCVNKINWFNSVAEVSDLTGEVYFETTRIFNKFNSVQLVKGVKVNVPTGKNYVIKRPYGLIWSGIYNGRTDVNRLNQFITADGITKELEPNYGSLQKLHTRDTNVIAACEDKIFRILADKDLLYNADGGGNVSASNRVLGQTTPFVGEYGISKHPESFASYGNNFWITDASRGVVLQVTPANGQINEISSNGLKDHFRDRLHSASKLVGAYDDYSNSYMLSMQGYDPNDAMIDSEDAIIGETSDITWRYEVARQGWSSRVSYIPEGGLSLNNKFYTYKNGKIFVHNSNNVPRNHFYNLPVKDDLDNPGEFLPTSYASEVEVILNENPSALKDYLTLGYEGTPGWVATSIDTDSEDLTITNTWPFVKKEDKYFAPIVGQIPTYGLTDAGLGDVIADDGSTVFINGYQDKSGIKGFYNKVRLQNALETKAELFAINSENKISSN